MTLLKTYFIKSLKFSKGILDLVFSSIVFVPVYLFYMIPAGAAYRKRRPMPGSRDEKCILYLIPGGGLANVLKKHDDIWMYREKDLDGYFQKVICLNFAAPTSGGGVFDNGKFIIIDQIRYLRTLAWLTTAIYTIRAFALVLRHNPDVIRAQDGYQVAITATLAARLTATPYCISLHADNDLLDLNSGHMVGPFYLGSRHLAKLGERWALSRAPFVLPISKHVADYAVRSGARPESIRIIYHGRNPADFNIEPDAATFDRFIKPDVINIVLVSRIHREKYVFEAVKAGAELRRRGVPFHFIICGDGPHRGELESELKQLDLLDSFFFPGFVSSEDVVRVTKACDVNIVFYGGWALIEAAMSGKPIVAYDIEWHAEFVENGVTGMLVTSGDAPAAADAIIHLHEDPELAKRIACNARNLAMQRHTMPHTQRVKQQVMDEIIETFNKEKTLSKS